MNGTLYNGRQVDFDSIIGNAKFHHQASCRGYISRKLECVIEDYSGKFGTGFKVYYPNYKNTRFVTVQYYVKELP